MWKFFPAIWNLKHTHQLILKENNFKFQLYWKNEHRTYLPTIKTSVKLDNVCKTISFRQSKIVIFERMETHKVCSTLTSAFCLEALCKSSIGNWAHMKSNSLSGWNRDWYQGRWGSCGRAGSQRGGSCMQRNSGKLQRTSWIVDQILSWQCVEW